MTILLILLLTLPNLVYRLHAQVDFGVGIDFTPGAFERTEKTKKEPEQKNELIERISVRFNQNYDQLHKLHLQGYGYNELIKLLLIADKSKKSIEEIVKSRDKKDKIAKIATSYGLNYKEIYFEAHIIRTELEQETTQQYKTGLEQSTTQQYNKQLPEN